MREWSDYKTSYTHSSFITKR